MYLIISLLVIFLQFVCGKEDKFVIPLLRQKSLRETVMNVKDVKLFNINGNKRNGTNDTVAIYRYMDSEFYGVIQIGKKARPFNLIIDTAWGDSWVMSEDCSYYTVGCWFHNKYDHTKSSSYIENGTSFFVNEGSYNLTGYYSIDTFHLEQLNVTNQTFIEMTMVPPLYSISKGDGVLGLGYASLSQGGVLPGWYLNTGSQHVLKNHSIVYLPVIQTGYWQFQMDRIQMDYNNKTYPFCVNGCYGYPDTSETAITGPDIEIQKINRLIGAKYIYIYTYGRYQVPCDTVNKLPPITFIIADKEFTLQGRDYIQLVSYKSFTLCLSAFKTFTNKQTKLWSMGAAFLSEFYSIYNLETNEIGFVKAA